MRVMGGLLALILAFLVCGAASAQEAKGWLGADVRDVTKAEADKLGWDTPHGAKVGVMASDSPAEKAGIKTGDVVVSIDNVEPETSSDFERTIAAKSPGTELRLRVLSGGRERRITVILAAKPQVQAARDQVLPLLMLDTGGHMAAIRGLTFTPDGKNLISAGDDKVIRVWDWRAGKTVRTIRGQVGAGDEGKIFALALSLDGQWLAVGGWTHSECAGRCGDIRLYDFPTSRLVTLLKGHTNVVNALAFSHNGKQLISGSNDNSAIIWNIEHYTPLHRLQVQAREMREISAVGFTSDGERAVTGGNPTLHLWRAIDGRLIAEMKGHTHSVRALSVRSSDSMIASGDVTGEIRLWDGRGGQYLRTLTNQHAQIGNLTFSPDGKSLLSTVGFAGPKIQRVWEVATGKELVAYSGHDNSVYAGAISADGSVAATGGGNRREVHIWDPATGANVDGPEGKPLVLVGTGTSTFAVGFSADGRQIAWGTIFRPNGENDLGPIGFQLRLPTKAGDLGQPERTDEGTARSFVRARAAFGPYALIRKNSGRVLDMKQGETVIASMKRGSTDGYQHRAYTFTPDGQMIVSAGTAGWITAYDLNGQMLGRFIGHEGDILAVTTSPDGRFLLSGGNDQTTRLWNLKTRELIVTLFHGTDGEWVMWTPQGYYTGSPGADKVVGWQINKGPDQVGDYVGAEQLRQHLNRPDIVAKAIILASALQAVREAPGTTFKLTDLLKRPVPRFKIVAPVAGALQHDGHASVRIAVEDTPDPVKAIRVQVNGRQVDEITPEIGSGGFEVGERPLYVPLAKGRNEVRITLTNAIGEKAQTLTLMHEGDGLLDKRGTLYIVAIGVEKYPGLGMNCGKSGKESCDLTFSGADARALVEAVEARLGPAHTKVVKRLLVNGAGGSDDPTAANILNAIDLLKEAKETDTVLVFIAGHGFNDGPNYRFLPTNAEWTGSVLRGATVVPWYALQEAVETAKGRRILFVDTCHAGNAYNQTLSNAAYHANIIAYTAARFDQEALEDPAVGHGLFTYAVVEGLNGKGAGEGRRQISTKELADYVIKRVEEMAKEQNAEQEPQYFRGRDAEDYVLAQ
jgi:WD40 repeat protein